MFLFFNFFNAQYKYFIVSTGYILFYFCLILVWNILFDNYESLKIIINFSLVFSVTIISILGISELYFGMSVSPRPGSVLSIRNFAAEYCACCLPFIYFILFKNYNSDSRKSKLLNIFLAVSLYFVLSYLLLLRTKSGILAGAVGILLFLFLTFFNKEISLRKKSLFIAIIIFISTASFFTAKSELPGIDKERKSLSETISKFNDLNYSPNTERIKYAEKSFDMFKSSPWTGIGTGNWFGMYSYLSCKELTDENVDFNSSLNPHNVFLEILSEQGIIVFCAVILLIFYTLYLLIKKSKQNSEAIPYLVSYISILICAFFSFTNKNFPVMLLFTACLGFALSKKRDKITVKEENKNKKTVFKFSLLLIMALLQIFLLFRYIFEKKYLEALKFKAQKKYDYSIELFDNIKKDIYPVDANNIPIDYYAGAVNFEMGKYDEALKNFDDALTLNPYYPSILSNRASTLYYLNRKDEAEKIMLFLREKYPIYYEPQINLLALYINEGRINEAKNLFNEIGHKIQMDMKIKNIDVFFDIKKYLDNENN